MVDSPERKPWTCPKAKRKKAAVKSSGSELEMALMVAPLTP